MKKNYIFFAVMFAALAASAQCDDIFISEVTEGSGNNKYMELYNGTDATVYLSYYALANTSNAPTTVGEYEFWFAFPAGDSILPGGTYVVGHGSADPIITAKSNTSHNFLSNGDDGYKLVKGGTWNDADTDGNIDAGEMTGFTVIDGVGDWQGDPGDGWAVAGVADATKDHTLVRKSWYGGNSDWSASAGTDSASSEWLVIDKDEWSGLGNHRSVCTGIQNPGFDVNEEGYKIHWKNSDLSASYNEPEITSSPIKDGVKASKLRSDGSRVIYQAVTVKPMTAYTVKFWYTIDGSSGSGNIAILGQHTTDTTEIAANTIASTEVTDMTDKNVYVQDSVTFTSIGDVIAIYGTSSGVTTRFDAFEIVEGPAAPPVVAAIKNPGYDIEGNNSYKDFWTNRDLSTSYNEMHITGSPIYEGIKAGKLPSDGTRIAYQAVNVKPMTTYTVRYWYTMKSGTGTAQVDILDKHTTDAANLTANTIATTAFTDQTDENTYVQDSVVFTSVGDTVAIYVSNSGVEVRFDSWEIAEGGDASSPTEPMTAAPDPTHDVVDVISIYSESYTDPAGINYYPDWSQTTQYSVFEIGQDSMIKYSALNYQGIDFNASEIDASSMEMLHIDIWTADVDSVLIFPISRGGEKSVNNVLTAGQWNSIDIRLTDYTSQGLSMADIFQFKFDNLSSSRGTGTIFIDNMYFWKEPTLVYNTAAIEDVIGLDADFYPTNIDLLYEVTGVVYGVDLQGNDNLAFTIIDATDGMGVFAGGADGGGSLDGYVVTEGDEVTIKGKLGFFNGLTQIIADSIKLNSSGNSIKAPTEVTSLSEATESDLVQLTKVWLVDNSVTEWPNNGNIDVTNGTDIVTLRIDGDTKGIGNKTIEFDTMNIVGIGGQFDNSAPYDEGYQLFPMDSTDIVKWVDNSSVRNIAIKTSVYPNPTSGNLTVIGVQKWNTYQVFNVLGGIVSEGSLRNNNLTVAELNGGTYIVKLYAGEKTGISRFVVNK